MYYIVKAPAGKLLAAMFAFFMMVAALGIGNMFQANQVAVALEQSFAFSPSSVGLIFAFMVAAVIMGGATRIANVASFIVPLMGALYVLGCLITIAIYRQEFPAAVALILQDAVSGQAAAGGAIGTVIIQGVRRALFSSEAGLGSAPVAHSLVKTNHPITEGFVALLEPFIDTVVICTITALTICVTGVWQEGGGDATLTGVALTQAALDAGIPGFGRFFIPAAVFLFAFSTAIAWSLYGQNAALYLTTYFCNTQKYCLKLYKVVFVLCAYIGCLWSLDSIIAFTDICLAMMVIPNVWAMLFLSGHVKHAKKEYLMHKAKEFRATSKSG